jgi:hypothetical protein
MYEIKKIKKVHVGTIKKHKYQVRCQNESPFDLSSATYTLTMDETGEVIASGSATVKNDDLDRAGNTIHTVQCTINYTHTELVAGETCTLELLITFTNGETDVGKLNIELVN